MNYTAAAEYKMFFELRYIFQNLEAVNHALLESKEQVNSKYLLLNRPGRSEETVMRRRNVQQDVAQLVTQIKYERQDVLVKRLAVAIIEIAKQNQSKILEAAENETPMDSIKVEKNKKILQQIEDGIQKEKEVIRTAERKLNQLRMNLNELMNGRAAATNRNGQGRSGGTVAPLMPPAFTSFFNNVVPIPMGSPISSNSSTNILKV